MTLNEPDWLIIESKNFWKQVKHAKVCSDLVEALTREILKALSFERGPGL